MAAYGRSATKGVADRHATPSLHLRLFCHIERIIDFDTQVPQISVDKIADPQLHEIT